MQPIRIRAYLSNGFAAKDPWSPAIDGILAAVEMKRRLGEAVFASPQPSQLQPVEGLPIEVVRYGDLWWYAASSPIIVGFAGREKKHFHRRFDDYYERYLPETMGRVLTAAGPLKSTRLADTRIICTAVEWHVVGEADAIVALLDEVVQIGGKRGTGFGLVRWWDVDDGDQRTAYGHRPLPVGFQEVQGAQVMPWGLVPPGRWRPVECVMPQARYADA